MIAKNCSACQLLGWLALLLPAAAFGADEGENLPPQRPMPAGNILGEGKPSYSEADLKKLEDYPDLQGLEFFNMPVTDAAIDHLKAMKKLRQLCLTGTRVSDAGLRRLQLQSHPRLRSLDLAGTPVTDAGLEYVGRITTLRRLTLDGKVGDAGLGNLRPLGGLEQLVIEGDSNGRITDAGMRYLGQFSKLRTLVVSSGRVTDAGIANLGNLRDLVYLYLSCKQVTDAGIANLKCLKRLTYLTITGDRITGAGFEDFEGLSRGMNELVLRGNGVTDDGMRRLKVVDGKLVSKQTIGAQLIGRLSIASDQITDDGLAPLEGMEIGSLEIGGPKVTDAGLKHLKNVTGLSRLNLLRNTIKGSGLEYLKQQPSMVGNRHLPQLAEAVP